jgi:hypothetical protein
MSRAIAWYAAARIIGQFDAGIAESAARRAADPTYKPDPFAPCKAKARPTAQEALDAVVANARRRAA